MESPTGPNFDTPPPLLPLSYESQPPRQVRRPIKTVGLILMLVSALCFLITMVGLFITYRSTNNTAFVSPAQLSTWISRSMSFTAIGLILLIIGMVLRAVGSQNRPKG